MKKVTAFLLAILMLIGLCACGAPAEETAAAGGEASGGSTFRVGFARVDATPYEPVPMSGYGNSMDRISTGMYSFLYLNILALNDGTETLLLMSIDYGWFQNVLSSPIVDGIVKKYGIPKENILMQGTHTHAAMDATLTEVTAVANTNARTVDETIKAVGEALEDMKPAEIYVGTVETENMNFVRRYFMDDGSLIGDNFPGTGTEIVAHETQADNDLQLMKFVREGGKDILVMNFQAHPQLETRSTNISGQTPYFMRDAVEKRLGILTTYWQGAAGNINSQSRIESEMRTTDRVEYGEIMADYVEAAYNTLEKVEAGPIKVMHTTVACDVNHTQDYLVAAAKPVVDEWQRTGSTASGMKLAEGTEIRSVYHANAIISKASMEDTRNMQIAAFSFGDIGGVVVPYEMFDTSGMQIKDGSPFAKTFIFGYASPGGGSYIPDEKAFDNEGYETNQCRFVRGTAEKLVAAYLDMLSAMK